MILPHCTGQVQLLDPSYSNCFHQESPQNPSTSADSGQNGESSDFSQSVEIIPVFAQRFERECLDASAISPSLYRAAVKFIEDTGHWEPNEALGHQVSRFWVSRQPHNFGVLACFHQEDGELWQAKPENPRVIDGDPNKYEAPKGVGSKPYLPPVDRETRQQIARRTGLDVPLEGSFWEWAANTPAVPIVYTEGAKKALALLSQGYVAISLYGVNAGYRTRDKLGYQVQPHLISGLERFCQPGRPVTLAFDQDQKPKTRRRVTAASFRFGGLLAAAGCAVKLALWEGSQGKGVDDLIAQNGPEAFHRAMGAAYTLDEYRLKLALQNRLQGISPALRLNTRDLSTIEGTAIPETGIVAISSGKGSGKTKLIGGLTGGDSPALLAGHRIALTRNLCSRLGIRYRGDLDRVNGRFTDGSGYTLRVGTVVDSLLAINPADFTGCDLILDEVVQVLRHLLTSSTCNKDGKRAALLARFTELVQSARRVILADADLDSDTIRYIQQLRGDVTPPWVLVNDAQVDPWEVQFIEAPDATAITAQLLRAISDGQRVFVATDSKAGSKRLNRLIEQIEGIGRRVLLLNSETSGGEFERAFIEAPDQNLNYDVVIATPSMATGVSIEAEHFTSVYGIFWGASSTDADMAQALARVRAPIPRVVWCAERGRNFSRIGRDTNPIRLKKLLQDKTSITGTLTAASLGASPLAELQGYDWTNPHIGLWATYEASQNRSMLALRSALKVRLIHEGHRLSIEQLDSCLATKEALKAAKLEIDIMTADAITAAANLTATEAKALESCEVLSPDEQLALKKWHLSEFYCVPLEDITADLVLADNDGRRRGQLRNLEEFIYPEAATSADQRRIEQQAQWERGLTPWDVPHAALKREIRKRLGIRQYIDQDITWTSDTLEDFKAAALGMVPQIKGALNVTIRPEMSAAQILGILLEQLGLRTDSQQFREGGKVTRRYWLRGDVRSEAMAVIQRRAERRQNAQPAPVTHPPVLDINQGCVTPSDPPILRESGGGLSVGAAVSWMGGSLTGIIERWEWTTATVRSGEARYYAMKSELSAA